jgi:hypothetical protein
MGKMGRYCKAYPVSKLRQFPRWTENVENLRKEKKQINGKEEDVERELTDNDFLYLQENLIVTDGIYVDEHIIFNNPTPEWRDFCHETLGFSIPVFETVEVKAGESETAEGSAGQA